jgi:ATP-dependent RNA helicase DeaD
MTVPGFRDLTDKSEILRAIEEQGFEEPTPIQALAIPVLRAGRDVTGQAQTGTGKTIAFGIPTIERINPIDRHVQVLVLTPTRELALQVAEEFGKLLRFLPKIKVLPVYGGQSLDRQIKALAGGVQIVIGTPGRVIDHLGRKTLSLSAVHTVILDEADRMLDIGFREDIERILSKTTQGHQTVLFSATIPESIHEISRRYQTNPEFIRVEHHELTVPQIDQSFIELPAQEKLDTLCRLIDTINPSLSLIFRNTKRGAESLRRHLKVRGYSVEALHGDMKQSQRERVMAGFRKGAIEILVATDVAARGIDVEGISLVINFDVPQDVEYYVHRIGRTGRAGREGQSITFVAPGDYPKLREIQRFAKITIARLPFPPVQGLPTDAEALLHRVKRIVESGKSAAFIPVVEEAIRMGNLTSLDMAAALLAGEGSSLTADDMLASGKASAARKRSPARRRSPSGRFG